MFTLIKNHYHGNMMAAESHDLTPAQVQKVRQFLEANRLDDPAYQARTKARPFLQGCDDEHWALVEFWTANEDAVVSYIRMLNWFVFGQEG